MIERILPAGIASHELRGDSPEVFLPGEEAFVAGAVAKRRREFSSVRYCARRAMAERGVTPAPLLRGEHGAPVWPAGVVGSMTHCDGYRAAAVALSRDVKSVGIDAEPALPLPDGVLSVVATSTETRAFPQGAQMPWDRLLFSAKESVYKAWFPVMRRWLDFTDAHIELRREGTFTARLLPEGADIDHAGLRDIQGQWCVDEGLVLTSVVIPREG